MEPDPQVPAMDFAKRVQHFDIVESDKSDDDDLDASDRDGRRGRGRGAAHGGTAADGADATVVSADDIEKEYLMGGRTSFGDDEDGDDTFAADNRCCANSCGGTEKASRIEGRGVLLASTIISMALGGLLLYSSWHEWNAANRKYVALFGLVLGGLAELCGTLGLIGLCRFSDTSKVMFKLGFWVNLIQYWAYAAYFVFLLWTWDGNFKHGTQPISPAAGSLAAGAAPASTTTTTTAGSAGAAPALIELAVELNAETASAALAAAGTLAPTSGSGYSAAAQWNALLGTQIWFLGLVLGQVLCSVLYVYGSLRLRCKKMGKWGTAITGFLLALVAFGTITTAALTIKGNPSLITVAGLTPLAVQIAVAALMASTVIYEWVVSTRVAKQKQYARPSFVTLQVLAWVAFVAVSVCHYTYYQCLTAQARIDMQLLTALGGTLSQLLVLLFAVQIVAWQYALPEEYPMLPAVEKFGPAGYDETEAFVPPSQPLEI